MFNGLLSGCWRCRWLCTAWSIPECSLRRGSARWWSASGLVYASRWWSAYFSFLCQFLKKYRFLDVTHRKPPAVNTPWNITHWKMGLGDLECQTAKTVRASRNKKTFTSVTGFRFEKGAFGYALHRKEWRGISPPLLFAPYSCHQRSVVIIWRGCAHYNRFRIARPAYPYVNPRFRHCSRRWLHKVKMRIKEAGNIGHISPARQENDTPGHEFNEAIVRWQQGKLSTHHSINVLIKFLDLSKSHAVEENSHRWYFWNRQHGLTVSVFFITWNHVVILQIAKSHRRNSKVQ